MIAILHAMQRDVGVAEEADEIANGTAPKLTGHNWVRVNTGPRGLDTFALGKMKEWQIPGEWKRQTKLALQTVSNFRYANIHLPASVKTFYRLYFRNTVFHSSEVRIPIYSSYYFDQYI